MIDMKDARIPEVTASSSSGSKRTDPGEANDSVLTDLFRARMSSGPLTLSRQEEEPQRAAPLISSLAGAGPSLFQAGRSKAALGCERSPTNSLFHQLGQQAKRFKPASVPLNNNSDEPFPLPSGLFSVTSTPSRSAPFPTSSSSASGSQDVQLLDQSIRSLSTALMVTGRTTTGNSQLPTLKNRRRPLRHQATRMRLVGQVLGPRGVQRVITAVKEMKQLQQQQQQPPPQDDDIVDAWENTPLEDLKGLPWDTLLRDAEKKLEAYHHASSKMTTAQQQSS